MWAQLREYTIASWQGIIILRYGSNMICYISGKRDIYPYIKHLCCPSMKHLKVKFLNHYINEREI